LTRGKREIHVAVHRADRARHHLQRRFYFRAVCSHAPELFRFEQGSHHFAHVAAGLEERLRHAVHQRGRRLIGHEALRQLMRMNFAVEGCFATMSRTFIPSSMPPPAAMVTPSTVFSPRSCMRGLKRNSPPRCGWLMVHPVKQRAVSVTSFCV
jgi:hypothetical protein